MAGELNKVGEIEAKNAKGIRLHELTKITTVSCPGKVAKLFSYYIILNIIKWYDNGWKLEGIWIGCFRSFSSPKMKEKIEAQQF